MKTDIRRLAMFAAALLFAAIAGYGIAKLTVGQDAGPTQDAHADHDGDAEKDEPDDHGHEEAEGEEGLIVLTQQQIEVSGIQVVGPVTGKLQ